MGRVNGKVAIVTGGAAGLGASISTLLVREGAKVTITDVLTQQGLELAATLNCEFLEQDVTDERQWDVVVSYVEQKHGGLHILVNNAGVIGNVDRADPETTSLVDWRAIQVVNVEGVFLGCRAAIPVMRRSGGGSIVNISSESAIIPEPYFLAYGASKAAVRHLTKSVAMYCAKNGSKVRCNSVHPGIILTSMVRHIIECKARSESISMEESTNRFKSTIPMGEFQEPVDIAHGVLYLASDEARFVTGTKLCVDGGDTMEG